MINFTFTASKADQDAAYGRRIQLSITLAFFGTIKVVCGGRKGVFGQVAVIPWNPP